MIGGRGAWVVVLDLIVLGPLAAAVLSPVTRGTGLAVNLSVGLGLLGTSLLAMVVLLVSRVRGLTRALGLDVISALHRWLGAIAVVLVLAHAAIAVAIDPRGWQLLDLTDTTGASRAAVLSMVALLLLVVLVVPTAGVGRYALRARLHAALTGIGLLAAAVHIVLLRRLVADPLVAGVLIATALVVVAVLLQRWVLRPLLDHGSHVVIGVRPEGATTSTLVLAPTHLRHGLSFEPGQFVWLRLHREVAFTAEHPFTIAAGSRAGRLELTIRRQGDFTTLLRHLEPGRRVWVDGPHGAFVPTIVPAARGQAAERHGDGVGRRAGTGVSDGLVLVAGGVGITPIMSILRALAQAGDPRPHLLLVAHRPGEELFGAELDALTRRLRLDVVRLDRRRLDVELLSGVLPAEPARYDYFLCGPDSLIDSGVDALADYGVPSDRVHLEKFR